MPSTFRLKTFPLQSTAQQMFAAISHFPWAVLLESASPDHVDSRFDIFSAAPIATLETVGPITTITEKQHTHQSSAAPLALLKDVLQRQLGSLPTYQGELPFIGGALGLLGYDLGRQIEKLPAHAIRDIDLPDLAVGIYDWAWVLDHQTQEAHLVVCGSDSELENRWQWWLQQAPQEAKSFSLTSHWQANVSKEEYTLRFEAIQRYLRAGDCYQINLTQRFNASYTGDEWQAYCQLSQVNQAPFSAFMRLPNAAILSLSPERFLALNDQQVETKPIKGTRPRYADPQADQASMAELKNASKDRAENLMIVDLLRNDIGRVCKLGSVRVPKLFDIESFNAVHHMVSTVTGTLDTEYTAAELLHACFPGGSITGAPKIRAMQIIEELEPHRRSAYCGSMFYISRHGRMDSSITIRTLIAWHDNLYVWAGGGIVADSEVNAEYQETFDKLAKILPVLEKAHEPG
ncbi:aminodeoxychorismate synthase component I [Tolumonas lignilytica]|uniref:aminodeoxychorismate synthase component I n=1 Tax=Tolumonas lignilytica TaxID=1283284 RepID=UPI00046713E3